MAGAGSVRRRAYSLEAGDRIGPYVCVRPLAMGGMAELHVVAEAGGSDPDALSVVKCMLPHLAADPEFATMFLKEARLARGLDHPNITRLLDCGEDQGDFFIVLEYVHGYDLRHLVRAVAKSDAALPLDLAVGIALEVCRGLHHAHEHADERGRPLALVHRDVTPSNVLLGLDGRVLLTDFGIARALTTMKTTRAGVIKGKLGYMSPEQCRDAHLDRRSDVFSVGVLLYEMTTGFRMFHAGNDFAVLNKIAKGEYVSPSEASPGYPPGLESIIRSCVSVDPGERPASAHALEQMLDAFMADHGLSVDPGARATFVRQTLGDRPRPRAPELAVEIEGEADRSVSPLSGPAQRRRPWGFVAALAIGGVAGGAAVLASRTPPADASAGAPIDRDVGPAKDDESSPEVAIGSQSRVTPESKPDPDVAPEPASEPKSESAPQSDRPTADATVSDPASTRARPKKRRKRRPTAPSETAGSGAPSRSAVDAASPGPRTILPPSMRKK